MILLLRDAEKGLPLRLESRRPDIRRADAGGRSFIRIREGFILLYFV